MRTFTLNPYTEVLSVSPKAGHTLYNHYIITIQSTLELPKQCNMRSILNQSFNLYEITHYIIAGRCTEIQSDCIVDGYLKIHYSCWLIWLKMLSFQLIFNKDNKPIFDVTRFPVDVFEEQSLLCWFVDGW